MSADVPGPENFNGMVRLFPLPNLVLFPAVVQPLHIFEPRYRDLLADALKKDRLIAMALLRPGVDASQKRAAVHPVVCVGKVFKEERQPDGRYNLLLHGQCRARILDEPRSPTRYRIAHVELLHDVPVPSRKRAEALRQKLSTQLREWFATQTAALEHLARLLQGSLSLGTLGDVFSFALPLEVEAKQRLLEEVRVERRIESLLDHLAQLAAPEVKDAPAASERHFPPEFSRN